MSKSRVILTIEAPKYKARPSTAKAGWVAIEKNGPVEKGMVDLSNQLACTVVGIGARLAAQSSERCFYYSNRGSKFVAKFEVPAELREHCDIDQIAERANDAMGDAAALLADWAGQSEEGCLAEVRLAAQPAPKQNGSGHTILVRNADATELVRPLAKLVRFMATDPRFEGAALVIGRKKISLNMGLPKTMEGIQTDSEKKVAVEGTVSRLDGTRHTLAITPSSGTLGRKSVIVDYSASPSPNETRELLGYAFAHQEPVVVTGYHVYKHTCAGRIATNRIEALRVEASVANVE